LFIIVTYHLIEFFQDIRSFFKISNNKKDELSSLSKSSTTTKPKRKANSSDDETETVKHHDTKKKRRIIDSDEEDEKPKPKKSSDKSSPAKKEKQAKKLVEVDVMSMFGSEPVKRKERPKVAKPSLNTSASVIKIEDDDETLDLDVSALVEDIDKHELAKKKATKKPSSPEKKSETIVSSSSTKNKKEIKPEPKKSPVKSASPKKPEPVKKRAASQPRSPTPKKAKASESRTSSVKKEKKSKEPKEEKVVTIEDDEARQERKQAASALFHKMKNRVPVLNPGSKDIPKGKPDCLKGMQFVISGILESMEREEAASLIKECGGKVVSGLSSKVTHLLVGDEPGPAKIAKAEEMGIIQLTEDELLNLIRKKSGLPVVKSTKTEDDEVVDEVKKEKDSPGKENRVTNDVKTESPEKKVRTEPVAQQSQVPLPAEPPKNMDDFSFVDKYKPTSMKQIIGQQGSTGNAQKLMNWLSKWHKNNDGKTKHAKPNPWAKDNDGVAYKAALLSGSPGVGKTTTAHLVCKELLFDIVEFNASDTRSKKLLKEEVSALLSNTSISGYAHGSSLKPTKRHVLIMDEVDGMAGNEDRGGVAELIALIKDSHIPVICMCNDRNHPKIRSLANYCFDLRFSKPSIQQIRGAMMSICFKEGIKIEAGAVDEIIGGTGNDIRQTLNHLALYSASKDVKLLTGDAKKNAEISEKDIKIVS
jgi:replication factor C subunit 1